MINSSQPSDVWQFSCHNYCSQLCCEFSTLKNMSLSHSTFQYPDLNHMWIFQFLPWKPSNFYIFPIHIFALNLVIYLQYYLWKCETFNLFYITLNIHFFKHFNENINYQWQTNVKFHLNFTLSHRWWHSVIIKHLAERCI